MNEVTWLGVAISALALVGTIASSYSQRRQARDKMEFDAKATRMEAQIETQNAGIKQCEEDRAELKVEIKKCRDEHKTAEVERRDLEVRVSALESGKRP